MRIIAFLTATMLAIAIGSSCDGGAAVNVAGPDTAGWGLPALKDLPHANSIVSNDTVNGSDYIAGQHNTDSGTAVLLDSAGLAAGDIAYSIYQLAERPGETPTTITTDTLYLDQHPLEVGQYEGYWIGYGDFSSGTDGAWRFAGPFMQYQGRVTLPASVDVTNSGGQIFVAIIMVNGSRVKVNDVQVGYNAGVGYESYKLAAPRGAAVGRLPKVAVDSTGQPQIAYLQARMNFGSFPYKLKIAKRVGGEWQRESVTLPYEIEREYAFACGGGGRRALLVINSTTGDLHLLWDDGGGAFADVATLWLSYNEDCNPALAFVNSADDPLGELDTALAVFGGTFVSPNSDIHFYRYDGVNPPATALFLNVRKPGKINLMVEGTMATLAIPLAPAYPIIDGSFLNFSAVTNTWMAPPIGPLASIPLEDTDDYYGLDLRPMGGGEYVAGFCAEDEGNIIFSHWDGVAWTTQPQQQVSCVRPEPWLAFDTFSDGTTVFPTHYNGFNLAVYEGDVGGGAPFTFYPMPSSNNNAFETSIAVGPDDTAHIAASNPASGRLDYYAYHQGGTIDPPVAVDECGDGFGVNYGPCGVVYTADALHIFSVDSAHSRVLHSENRNGVWVRESEVITPFDRYAYLLFGAGYLETTGQLWVAFVDGVDMGVYASYTDPPGAGGWNWHTYKLTLLADEPLIGIEDDETNLAFTSEYRSPFTGSYIGFAVAPLGQSPPACEPICADYGLFHYPNILSYNKVDQSWNLLTSDNNSIRSYLWHRAGPNSWLGPYLIAARTNASDTVVAGGITYDNTTGLARVLVYERDDTLNRFSFSIVGQQNSSWTFAPPITFMDEDGAAIDFGAAGCVADADGNPFVAIATKPVADATYGVEFYQYDGLGNWAAIDTWDSPFQSIPMDNIMYYPLAISPSGQYAFAATEMDTDSVDFGRIWVHYPW